MTLIPRAERLNLSFPVEFFQENTRLTGGCLNISDSGILARFPVELPLWSEGQLHLDAGVTTVQLHVRVVRSLGTEAAMAFRFHFEAEREAIRRIVHFAAQTTCVAGARPPF